MSVAADVARIANERIRELEAQLAGAREENVVLAKENQRLRDYLGMLPVFPG